MVFLLSHTGSCVGIHLYASGQISWEKQRGASQLNLDLASVILRMQHTAGKTTTESKL